MRLPKICLRHDWEDFYFTQEALSVYNFTFNYNEETPWSHAYGRANHPQKILPAMTATEKKNRICLKCEKIELRGDDELLMLCDRAVKARMLLAKVLL